jgi:hypothetical protein
MTRKLVCRLLAVAVLTSHMSAETALAQQPGSDAFSAACNTALNDIQDNRRICVLGIVQDDTKLRVLLSNKSAVIF